MQNLNTREEYIYFAKLAQKAHKYQDMYEAMNKVVNLDANLLIQQRNLLSLTYKNFIGQKRNVWRALNSLQRIQQQKQPQKIHLLKEYKAKIENELNKYCNEILILIETKLLKKVLSDENKTEDQIFYLKMKGDYLRYICQFTPGQENKNAENLAYDAYKVAIEKAEKYLKPTHSMRLGLSLNYSIFHYEIRNDASKACQIAKQAFDNAIKIIDLIEQSHYKEILTIMQLIKDNLILWTSAMEQQNDK